MKIALIVPGGVDRSGRERVIPALLWLIERLARRHNVLVIALDQEPTPARYRLLGAQVVNLGRVPRGVPAFGAAVRLSRLLGALRSAGYGFDVLHGFWAEPAALAGAAGWLLSLPVVMSVGGGELVRLPEIGYGGGLHWRGRLVARTALRLATAVTAGSHHALAPVTPVRPDARHLVLGADASLFSAPVPRPDGPPWRLLCVASINRVKDPETMLRAISLVASRQPGVRLDWVGGDTLGGEAQRRAAALGPTDIVHFHGFRPVDELAPFYRHAHLLVQSSRHESQGVAVCEAALAGLPAVGTAVGVVADLAPAAAVAVPVGDARALAGEIVALLRHPAHRDRLARAAQSWALAHDADWTAAQFEALYTHIRRSTAPAGPRLTTNADPGGAILPGGPDHG
jgi:glycosyltransferase involved in cell wall biosynthesis